MYEGLESNQPRQIMEYPDYPFPQKDKWYFSAQEVQEYLVSYSRQFGVDQLVQFRQEVLSIRPAGDGGWLVVVRDLQMDQEEERHFDYVMICNGHFREPRMVAVKGQDLFKGRQLHSVRYRKAEKFRGNQGQGGGNTGPH